MNIFLAGHDHRYAVEQLLLTLFPGERPAYPELDEGGDGVAVRLSRGERFAVASCRFRRHGRTAWGTARYALSRADGRRDAVRLEQKIVKLAFYRAALAWGREKPVWGALTGVRPAKFFDGLVRRDGLTPARARTALVREFGVDPDRAALCETAWTAAEEARRALSPEDVCLYVGIPYCPTRCAYCSFVSVDAPRLLRTIPDYLDALERELAALGDEIRKAKLRVRAVYIGGGTPTTLSAEQLDRLLGAIRDAFDLSACREFTVEAGRPDTVTPAKLDVLVRRGADRVSVNPQTMSDAVLEAIGRRHTAEDIRRAAAMVRETPLSLNMDLIAGLPGDTPDSFAASVEEVLSLAPENVTVHTLALKKGSRFLTEEGFELPRGEAVGRMLLAARERLSRAGYAPYYMYRQKYMSGSFENVGWTKPGRGSLYNICIMEELCSILSAGAGGSTKLTAPGGVVERIMAPKYPREYMERIGEVCASKTRISAFYRDHF